MARAARAIPVVLAALLVAAMGAMLGCGSGIGAGGEQASQSTAQTTGGAEQPAAQAPQGTEAQAALDQQTAAETEVVEKAAQQEAAPPTPAAQTGAADEESAAGDAGQEGAETPAPAEDAAAKQTEQQQAARAAEQEPFVIEERQGPFTVGGAGYTVVVREERIAHASDARFAETLGALAIVDAQGNVAYQEMFPANVAGEGGRFAERMTAVAQEIDGDGGSAILIRYTELSDAGTAPETWQMFGLVNGKFGSFDAPLALGQGEGIAVGGALTGVMLKGGIEAVPLASTADTLQFRAWAGSFDVDVPVRVDWQRGQWSQAQECYALSEGTLVPKGCLMHVEAYLRARGTEPAFVRLYAQPAEDSYAMQATPVLSGSAVQFLGAKAEVSWRHTGERIACDFSDVWLHVTVEGQDGWVHSEEDFAALGLPASPAPPDAAR